MAYVYKHIRKDTDEVFYIGIGTDNQGYLRSKDLKSRNRYWKYVVKKFGFTVEIVEDFLTWEESCIREQYWIKFYGRRDLKEGKLVNMTDGGDGLNNPSDEIRQKYRDLYSNKTYVERYGEERAKEIGDKISKSNTGKNYHTDEWKNSLSEKMIGNDFGQYQTNQTREIKRNKFLTNNPGKNKTEEAKQKMSNTRKGVPAKNNKPIIIDGVEYRSLSDASNKLNIHPMTIKYRVVSKSVIFNNYQYK
jgi:hypothetical protein